MNINIDKLVCSNFRPVIKNIITCDIGRLVLKGGRSSTKSQTSAEGILIGCMISKESAICIKRYQNKIKETLVDTFTSAINYMGLDKWWKLRKSPFEYVLLDKNGKETDVSIKFTGADDAELIKGYRSRRGGGFRYIWIEEVTQFDSVTDVNSLVNTLNRGVSASITILTYNPPQSSSNWVNKEYDKPCGICLGYESDIYEEIIDFKIKDEKYSVKQVVHHSCYIDVMNEHPDWLSPQWLADAESSKKNNPKYYKWNYLGAIIGTDANVFNNVIDWEYQDGLGLRNYKGLDASNGGPDPWAYVDVAYSKSKNCIYFLNEYKYVGNDSGLYKIIADNIKKLLKYFAEINIDKAVKTHGAQLRAQGLNIIDKKKNPIDNGMNFLRSLNGIYIDKNRCPNTYKEFKEYEYKIMRDGTITSEFPDMNNHFIDATRYALADIIRMGGNI